MSRAVAEMRRGVRAEASEVVRRCLAGLRRSGFPDPGGRHATSDARSQLRRLRPLLRPSDDGCAAGAGLGVGRVLGGGLRGLPVDGPPAPPRRADRPVAGKEVGVIPSFWTTASGGSEGGTVVPRCMSRTSPPPPEGTDEREPVDAGLAGRRRSRPGRSTLSLSPASAGAQPRADHRRGGRRPLPASPPTPWRGAYHTEVPSSRACFTLASEILSRAAMVRFDSPCFFNSRTRSATATRSSGSTSHQ